MTRISSKRGQLPPLASGAALMVLLLALLPSALNFPQSNPTETLEYAPIPANDEVPQINTSGLSRLGLSGSVGVTSAEANLSQTTTGKARTPTTKRCVGDPPKQTSDPLAPPCVANFEGDNGGATYRGVTREEIRVLFLMDERSWGGTSKADDDSPQDKYLDMSAPAHPDDITVVRALKSWQKYFNDRFQTYGRLVHFYAYFGKTAAATTPEVRRAQAADNRKVINPFATLPNTNAGYEDFYIEDMAERGYLNFISRPLKPESFFGRFPSIVWSYEASIEQQSTRFVSYMCTKVASHPVSFSGNSADLGKPRRYGLVYTTDPTSMNLRDFKDEVLPGLKNCGIEFAEQATYPANGYAVDTETEPSYAAEAMARFQRSGVTTIVWPAGSEVNFSKAAGAINYRPEWIVSGGDGFMDGSFTTQVQDQSVWQHAWGVSTVPRLERNQVSRVCKNAYLEVDPTIPQDTLDLGYACLFYTGIRQLFIGIQVAGPRLGPKIIDRGFHAIPAVASTSNEVPACFYERGDYTCIKDALAIWWDPQARNPDTTQAGCWRMAEGGRRYLAGSWPEGDVLKQKTANDPCSGYLGGLFLR